ncbi:MAG TPA: hypothetical protein VL625_10290, partial [Patescibacteria group bacterium]|nr:hypothetical protein [Patescibacteria group bacterium]
MTGETWPNTRPSLRGGTFGIQSFFLTSAIFVYAVAGSPTPDKLSFTEVLTGLLLVLASASFLFQKVSEAAPPWRIRAQTLLLYGLSVPLIVAFTAGTEPVAIVRDVIPFLFMLIPFFIQSPTTGKFTRTFWTGMILTAGVLFAARTAAHPLIHWLTGHKPVMADPLYLTNAPTVLFSALLLIGLAGRQLYEGATLPRTISAALMLAVSAVPLAAMILAKQRASFMAVLIYVGGLLLAAVIHRPRRAMLPLLALIALALAAGGVGLKIYHVMALKTELVGANMRWQEALAVFDSLDDDPFAILFGKGWGAHVASPAVGGETVNFTHSLLTSYWLKTGLCGLILVLLYLFEIGLLLLKEMKERPVLAAAIALPLLI